MFPRKGLSVAVAFLALSVVLAGCNNAKSFDPGHQILEAPAETISVHQLAARLNLNVTKRTPFHALLTDAPTAGSSSPGRGWKPAVRLSG